MDIHKPKPWHGLREFLKEYGIIVLGVLTALALEQLVEAIHWDHKVTVARRSLDYELTIDADLAYRIKGAKPCADQTFALMEQALVSGKVDLLNAVQTIYSDDSGNPFSPRPWRASSWETAQTGDVATHLGQKLADDYAIAFRFVSTERELQWKLLDDYAEVMSARLALSEPGRPAQLAALERYRLNGIIAQRASRRFLESLVSIGIQPTAEGVKETDRQNEACLRRLAASGFTPKPLAATPDVERR